MGTREEGLLWALPLAMVASVLIAWLTLRSTFRQEDPARLIYASLVVVLHPYIVLLLYVIGYAISPAGGFDRWATQWYVVTGLVCASAAPVLAFWRMLLARSRPEFRIYKAAAAAALVILVCLVAWGHAQVSSGRIGDSFGYAIPVVTVVSFLMALVILRSLFHSEASAKATFSAILIAQFACTLPPLLAIVYDLPVTDAGLPYLLWRLAGETLFFLLFFFFPAVFLIVLWLIAYVRHSLQGERSYEWEAWAALLIGACSVLWNADMIWSALETLYHS